MKILEKLSKQVASIMPYEPGKPIEDVARELGLDPNTIIKLASNENALGPSPKAIEAIRNVAADCHFYPDGGAYELRNAIAEKYGLTRDNVLVANGSNEVLELVGHCFLGPDRSAVFSQYAFIVYKLVSLLFGARMIEVPATPEFGHDLTAMRKAIDEDTSVVFVCTPNNPTGTTLTEADVTSFMNDIPDDVLVVFDEAYGEIAPPNAPDTLQYIHSDRPVLISHTFSKAYGLAGLRLGYALGNPALIRALNQSRQPFNCNLVAQVAGIAALEDEAFIGQYRKLCSDGKAFLENWCSEQSVSFVPSGGNFMLIKVGDGVSVFQELQKQGIIVRPMAGYGLPEYIRVTYGTAEQNQSLVESLSNILLT